MFATQRNLSNFYTFRRDASVLDILHHSNQRLQLLRSESLELLHNVCIIIQLQEPRIELHLLGKREGIDIAVGDISVYRSRFPRDFIYSNPRVPQDFSIKIPGFPEISKRTFLPSRVYLTLNRMLIQSYFIVSFCVVVLLR